MSTMEIVLFFLLLLACFQIVCSKNEIAALKHKFDWTWADVLRTATANAEHASKEREDEQQAEIKMWRAKEARRQKDDSYGNLVSHCISLRDNLSEALQENELLGNDLRPLSAVNKELRAEGVREVIVQAPAPEIKEMAKLKEKIDVLKRDVAKEKTGKENAMRCANEKKQEIKSYQGQIQTLKQDLAASEKAETRHKTGMNQSAIMQQLKNEKDQHLETKKSLEHSQNERRQLVNAFANERQQNGSNIIQQLKESLMQLQSQLDMQSGDLTKERQLVADMKEVFKRELKAEVDRKRQEMIPEYEAKLESLVQPHFNERVNRREMEMTEQWNAYERKLKDENKKENDARMAEHTQTTKQEMEAWKDQQKTEMDKQWQESLSKKIVELQEKVDRTAAFDANIIGKLQDQNQKLRMDSQWQSSANTAPYKPYKLPSSPAYTPYHGNLSPATPSYNPNATRPTAPTTPFSPAYTGSRPFATLVTSAHGSATQSGYSPTSPLAKSTMAPGLFPVTESTLTASATGNSTSTPSSVGTKHPFAAELDVLDENNPVRRRGPDSQREALSGPVPGEKRSHSGEEYDDDDQDEGRDAKKQCQEEVQDWDEGFGADED